MKPVTAWDFYFFRSALGLRQAVGGLTLERCVELPWCFNRMLDRPPQSLLDVGARDSIFPLFAAWKIRTAVTAMDRDPMILEQQAMTQRLAAKKGLDPALVSYRRMDATRMTFENNSFDAVTAISMIEHIPEETGDRAALAEIHRVLKPGGRLYLTVPSFREYAITTKNETVYDRAYDKESVFFERVYDEAALEQRLISATPLRLVEKTFFGQPSFDFSRFWWTKLPFLVKTPLRWSAPWLSAMCYHKVSSPAESKGLTLACLILEKDM